VAPRPLRGEARTWLGLPLFDALLVLLVAVTIAFTIVAFAAKTLGASDSGPRPTDRSLLDERDLTPVSTLGGPHHDARHHD